MKYSLWNFGKGAFDYFEDAAENPSLNAPKPNHLVNRTLGSTVEQAGWPLPAGARPVGSGSVAIGRVASRGGGSSLGDAMFDSPIVKAGLLVTAAILAYKYVLPQRRSR